MLKILRLLFLRRPSEPVPAEVVEINSALDKLRAAVRAKSAAD